MTQRFDGADIVHSRDAPRLTKQCDAINLLMMDGEWRTLRLISEVTGAPEASVSAQLRNLRKRRFGGYTVERKYLGHGLYAYRVQPKSEGGEQ